MISEYLVPFVAAILVSLFLRWVYIKVFNSEKEKFSKILLTALTLFAAIPLWYVVQLVLALILVKTIPQSRIVNCNYLNEEECDQRRDCIYRYLISSFEGSGRCIKR